MELQQIQTDNNDPYRYEVQGDFLKIELVPSNNILFIKTSSGETFKGGQGRSIKFEQEFVWLEITGQIPGEAIELQIGYGWILDTENLMVQGLNPTNTKLPQTKINPVVIGGVNVDGAGFDTIRPLRLDEKDDLYTTGKVIGFGDSAAGTPFTVVLPVEVDSTYRLSSWAIVTLGNDSGATGTTKVRLGFPNYNQPIKPVILDLTTLTAANADALPTPGAYAVCMAGADSITLTPTIVSGNPVQSIFTMTGPPPFSFK